MRASRVTERILAILAIAVPVLAQQEPQQKGGGRRPLVGTVVGSDERVIPGASVVVAHVPYGEDSLPARHHATATTDARGRFRIDVLAGVYYRAFAIGPPDERGTRFVSEVHETTANALLTLRATEQMPVRTFRLENPERWREFAPLRLRILPAGAELPGWEQPLDDDGSVVLPPLPSGYTTFEVLTADGVLETMTIRSTSDVAMRATPVWDVLVEVVDDTGQPVVGAIVQQRHWSPGWTTAGLLSEQSQRQTYRSLGTSDASGRLVARVPRADNFFRKHPGDGLQLRAAAPGHRAILEGTSARKAEVESGSIRLLMVRAAPPRVHLHWGGQPQSGVRLLAKWMVTVGSGKFSHAFPCIDSATTDDSGHAMFANLPKGVETAWLTLSEPPAVTQDLFPAHSPAPRVLLPPLEASDQAVLDVDLANFRRLHLRVLEQSHAPAQTARLILVPPDRRATAAFAEFPVDPTGQWTALVPPGPWRAFAANERSCTLAPLAVGGLAPQVLQFLPTRIIEGRVVNSKGEGLAKAMCEQVDLRFDDSHDTDKVLWDLVTLVVRRRPMLFTRDDGTFQLALPSVPGCVPSIRFLSSEGMSAIVAAEGDEPIELVVPDR